MVPEGLEWASAEDILDDIASVGFNYIRMYAYHPSPRTKQNTPLIQSPQGIRN
jgi:hypothetical protein